LISGPSRTRSGAGTASGCRSPVARIPATDAITARRKRSPRPHGYRRATVQCSTMPSTPPQCGYRCTAGLRCRLPPWSRLGESNPRPTHYERVQYGMVADDWSRPVLEPASLFTASDGQRRPISRVRGHVGGIGLRRAGRSM
jgi:hypothetical protein